MHNAPIKASYCDAWHTACKNDLFCASDSGDFFSCAEKYKAIDLNRAQQLLQQAEADKAAKDSDLKDERKTKTVVVVVAVSAVLLGALAVAVQKWVYDRRYQELEERLVVAGADETTEKRKTGEKGVQPQKCANTAPSVEMSGAVDVVGHASSRV